VCGGLLAPPSQVCDQFGCDGRVRVEQLLGMEVSSKYKKRTKWDLLLETTHSLVDLRYWVWFLGVVLSNMVRYSPTELC